MTITFRPDVEEIIARFHCNCGAMVTFTDDKAIIICQSCQRHYTPQFYVTSETADTTTSTYGVLVAPTG